MYGPEIFGLLFSIPINFIISATLLDKGIGLFKEDQIMLSGLYLLAFIIFASWIVYSTRKFWETYEQSLKK